MTWTNGRNLPTDWAARKRQRHELDGWRCVDCGLHDPTGRLLEADHIGHRDDHRIEALRTRCADRSKGGNGCHRKRTTKQAQAARPLQARRREDHPGLIRTVTRHARRCIAMRRMQQTGGQSPGAGAFVTYEWWRRLCDYLSLWIFAREVHSYA